MSFGIRTLSLVALILAFTAVLEHAGAVRDFPVGLDKNDKKEPEWLLDPDGSLLIPGVGRVMVPPKYRAKLRHLHGGGLTIPIMGSGGSPPTGGSPVAGGSPPTGRSYVPGGDDTYVPNPGVEVPNPARGRTPAPNGP